MEANEFRELVRKMRDAQRLYFTSRKPDVLMEAKRLEALVDNQLYERESGDGLVQPQLPF